MNIDWQNIDTVLLDMDGTLLDLHFDNHFWLEHLPAVMAQQKGMQASGARAHLRALYEQHVGTLKWYCVDFWSDELSLDIMALKADVAHKIGYRPNAQRFLQRCNQESSDVRMVTNAHRKILDLKIIHTKIDQYFDQMLCSHELDYPKERIEFWQRLQDHHAYDPARTLLVDDNETVLEAANQYGISHLYSIAKPDSQLQRETPSRFEMIEDFA